jgi:hypothetical protein
LQESLLLQGEECCSFGQKLCFWLHKEYLLLIHIGCLFVTWDVLDSKATFSNVTFNANTLPIFLVWKRLNVFYTVCTLNVHTKFTFLCDNFCFMYILFSWVWSFEIVCWSFLIGLFFHLTSKTSRLSKLRW